MCSKYQIYNDFIQSFYCNTLCIYFFTLLALLSDIACEYQSGIIFIIYTIFKLQNNSIPIRITPTTLTKLINLYKNYNVLSPESDGCIILKWMLKNNAFVECLYEGMVQLENIPTSFTNIQETSSAYSTDEIISLLSLNEIKNVSELYSTTINSVFNENGSEYKDTLYNDINQSISDVSNSFNNV